MIYKTYKFLLKPTKEQEDYLVKSFGACRFVYNYFLNLKDKQYKENGKSENFFELAKHLPKLKNEYEWLKEINSQSLLKSLQNLDTAFINFFKKKANFPKFKKKNGKQSFQVPQFYKLLNDEIKIPKVKKPIKFIKHREIKGKICYIIFSKTSTNKYFVSFLVECNNDYKKTKNGEIGIDLGIKDYAVLSNGEKIDNRHFIKKYNTKLKKLQKILSKKEKNSKRYKKCKLRIAKIHEKIANSRKDFQHKLSNYLTNNYKTICLEDLSIRKMMKNHNLAESIADCGWYSFYKMIEYKGKFKNCQIIKIDKFYPSSKTCSICNWKNEKLTLSDRNWVCPSCNTHHDRDINAAKNILAYGKAIIISMSSGIDDYKRREIEENNILSKISKKRIKNY